MAQYKGVNSLANELHVCKKRIAHILQECKVEQKGTIQGHPSYDIEDVRQAVMRCGGFKKKTEGVTSKAARVRRNQDGMPVCVTVMCMECNRHYSPHEINTRRLCIGCAAKHQLARARTLAEAEGCK